MIDTRGTIKDGIKGVRPQPAHIGIKSVLTSVYREGGARGLYRGVGMHVPESTNKTLMHDNIIGLSCRILLEFLFRENVFF